MKVKLVALRKVGKTLAGETFSVPPHMARALIALRHADYPPVEKPKRQYRRKDMVATVSDPVVEFDTGVIVIEPAVADPD